ncbi:hypothetical protein Tco_0285116 [Tanacetum coccineum]
MAIIRFEYEKCKSSQRKRTNQPPLKLEPRKGNKKGKGRIEGGIEERGKQNFKKFCGVCGGLVTRGMGGRGDRGLVGTDEVSHNTNDLLISSKKANRGGSCLGLGEVFWEEVGREREGGGRKENARGERRKKRERMMEERENRGKKEEEEKKKKGEREKKERRDERRKEIWEEGGGKGRTKEIGPRKNTEWRRKKELRKGGGIRRKGRKREKGGRIRKSEKEEEKKREKEEERREKRRREKNREERKKKKEKKTRREEEDKRRRRKKEEGKEETFEGEEEKKVRGEKEEEKERGMNRKGRKGGRRKLTTLLGVCNRDLSRYLMGGEAGKRVGEEGWKEGTRTRNKTMLMGRLNKQGKKASVGNCRDSWKGCKLIANGYKDELMGKHNVIPSRRAEVWFLRDDQDTKWKKAFERKVFRWLKEGTIRKVSYGRRGILFHPHAERIKKLSGDTSKDDGKGLGRSKRVKRGSILGRNSGEKQKKVPWTCGDEGRNKSRPRKSADNHLKPHPKSSSEERDQWRKFPKKGCRRISNEEILWARRASEETPDANEGETSNLSKKLQAKLTLTPMAWRLYLGKKAIKEGSGVGIILIKEPHCLATETGERKYKEEIMDATASFHRFRITHLPKILNSKTEVLTGLVTIKLEFLNQEVSVGIKTRLSIEVERATSKAPAKKSNYDWETSRSN